MANKNQYYDLDEIGFIGTQKKTSLAQQKQDAILTAQIIKAEKSGKIIPFPKTLNRRAKAV